MSRIRRHIFVLTTRRMAVVPRQLWSMFPDPPLTCQAGFGEQTLFNPTNGQPSARTEIHAPDKLDSSWRRRKRSSMTVSRPSTTRRGPAVRQDRSRARRHRSRGLHRACCARPGGWQRTARAPRRGGGQRRHCRRCRRVARDARIGHEAYPSSTDKDTWFPTYMKAIIKTAVEDSAALLKPEINPAPLCPWTRRTIYTGLQR